MLHQSEDSNTVTCVSGKYNTTISIEQFRQLLKFFISKAEHIYVDLMYGLETSIDISKLKDNITNCEPGYSFVAHPVNELKNSFTHLLTHTYTVHKALPALSGHGRQNWSAVKRYLRRAKELEEMVAGGLLTSGGQAPRLCELTNIECENSPSNARTIYLQNGFMVYIIRHYKAKKTINYKFNMVRFLLGCLGVVLVYYLIYIRYLANILYFKLE